MAISTQINGKFIQSEMFPPAQPAYVLRGHSAQVHSLHFMHQNLRLLSGDADGWVTHWSMAIKRPVAVWKAHSAAILGMGSWGDDKIITHGRDNKLCVWQLRGEDEQALSTILPIEDAVTDRKQPWLLHSLPVNALNFCSFAMCKDSIATTAKASGDLKSDTILVAVPGVQDGMINLTRLPSEERVATIPAPKNTNTGMLMAIGLAHNSNNGLMILAGYESGHAAIWTQQSPTAQWQTTYMHKPHTQPILSLDIGPSLGYFYTSSADAIVARYPLSGEGPPKIVQSKHAGQQSLTVRSDAKVFATAGWDGRVRVYSAKRIQELAVLKWHKQGCYALAFAEIASPSIPSLAGAEAEEGNLLQRAKTVSELRASKARSTHWLAAGSKDGKISLWDIY